MFFRPTLYKHNAGEISVDELQELGVRLLLLDADNTLRLHHGKAPCRFVSEIKERMENAGICLFITSNSSSANVAPFEKQTGIKVYSLCKKPLPFKINRIIKESGFKKSEIAIVGDQLFTDILCAGLCGVKSVLVNPVMPEKQWHFKARRALEKHILRRIKKRNEQ